MQPRAVCARAATSWGAERAFVCTCRAQSERFGTKIFSETVTKVDLAVRPFKVYTSEKEARTSAARLLRLLICVHANHASELFADLCNTSSGPNRVLCALQVTADTVIIATGAVAKRLEFPGSADGPGGYWNKGISACAVCDGAAPIFRNRPLAVIGGGDSAMEEANFLTKYGSKVYLIHRRGEFRASKIMAARALENPKIEVLWYSTVVEAVGDGATLKTLRVKNVQTDAVTEIECAGLFFAIGHEPASAFLGGQVATDEDGYIITKPGTADTNVPGVFACGDVQDKKWRQAITAAGSGCMAALSAEHYLSGMVHPPAEEAH